MALAYMGRILMVDLSTGEVRSEGVPDEVYEKYLGGMGLAAFVLSRHIPPGADALGPENMLGFLPGLLTATGSQFTGRWMVVGKSPLTGGWGDANCGGTFAPAIKRCGYDGIFFHGISERPVYLYVKGARAELRDAGTLWGKDAVEAEERLMEEHGPRARVALIGPAGERLSLISGVCNDRGRIAARSGLGAVMGSKRLKALVLDGKQRVKVYNRPLMQELSRKCNWWVNLQPPHFPGASLGYSGSLLGIIPTQMAIDGLLYKLMLKEWGTGAMNRMSIGMGDSPLKNWGGSTKDFGVRRARTVDPDLIREVEREKYHCYSCPLGCGGICSLKGEYAETHKPEYETVLALGGLCMNEDADSIFYLNEVLNRAGMDTISAGGTAAFAIECFENGILTREDTGGLELTWGNSEAIIALIKQMIAREGLGDILADGTKMAAQRIGRGSERFAIHAGGQEPAMHDGRNDPGFNLHYSVEPPPGRHTIGSQLYYEMFHLWKRVKGLPKIRMFYLKDEKYTLDRDKSQAAAACSMYMNLANSAGLCLFGLFLGVERIPVFEWLNAATGWNKTPEQYMEIGARIQTLKQAFNVRQGVDPASYKMHARALGRPPLEHGPNKGRSVEIERMMHDYWEIMGWDPLSGRPTPEGLLRMGIEDVWEDSQEDVRAPRRRARAEEFLEIPDSDI